MSTKSDRSPGSQFVQKGVTQGVSIMSDGVAVGAANPIPVSGTFSVGSATVNRVDLFRNVYSSSNATTSAYLQVLAATSGIARKIEIFDSSGQTLVLAFGAPGVEVNQIYITPGGNGQVLLNIPSGTRLSVKAISATANSGELTVNTYSN